MVIYMYVTRGTTEFRYSRDCFCTANDIRDHDIICVHDHLILLCTSSFDKSNYLNNKFEHVKY